MRQFICGGCVLALVAMLQGCKGDDKAGQTAPPPPPEVTVSQVITREVTDYEEFTGRTDAAESVEVRARVNGYLTEIHFTDGLEVKQGDLLYQIDARPFEAELKNTEGQKAQWEAKLARAKADVQRYERLVPTGAATQQDLDKVKADMGEAMAAIQSADATIDRAKLDLEFSRITAPISGQISETAITKGNLVRGDAVLLTTIVSQDPIYSYFNVNERTLLRLREQARPTHPSTATQPDVSKLKIPVALGLASDKGYPHQGLIDFADNRINPGTGTIRVRATFDNSKRIFKPGLFTRMRIPVSDPYQALLVAERAIGIDQGVKYVLVVDDKNVVERRFVEPGPVQDDGLQVMKSGLKPGDWVVVNGIQRARPGKPVTPKRADMPRRSGAIKTTTNVAVPGGEAGDKPTTPGN